MTAVLVASIKYVTTAHPATSARRMLQLLPQPTQLLCQNACYSYYPSSSANMQPALHMSTAEV